MRKIRPRIRLLVQGTTGPRGRGAGPSRFGIFVLRVCQNVPGALLTAPPSVSAGGAIAMGSCDHGAVRVTRALAVPRDARHHRWHGTNESKKEQQQRRCCSSRRRGRATHPLFFAPPRASCTRASTSRASTNTATAETRPARPRVVQRKDTLEDDDASSPGDVFATLSAPPEWASASTNPPLMGNFAPVVGECEIGDLEVEGSIPASVRGVYLRNGPNPAREPLLGAARYHWFDGDGMLHWIRLRAGDDGDDGDGGDARNESKKTAAPPAKAKSAASSSSSSSSRTAAPPAKATSHSSSHQATSTRSSSYSSSSSPSYGRAYVRTKNFEREREKGESLYTGLRDITPVWRVLLPRLFTKVFEDWRAPDSPFWVVQSKNTANNGVKAHAGSLLATYESGSAYEVELSKTLKTRGVCDFRGSFGAKDYWLDNMTAHAKTCPETGELVYIGYNLIAVPDFLSEKSKRERSANDDAGANTTDVVVGVVNERGERTSRRVVEMSRPSMQHDVGITRSRVVLLDGPLVFDLDRVLRGGLPFAFDADQTMRVGILPRDVRAEETGARREDEGVKIASGAGFFSRDPHDPVAEKKGNDSASSASAKKEPPEVMWVDTGEPCFAYHVVNCYDDPADPDAVVVDVCKSDGTNALGMARGFDDDADQGKNGYVGDDATGVVDENAFEAFVSEAARRWRASFGKEKKTSRGETNAPRADRVSLDDATSRSRSTKKKPALGSHANAVGHGRDVAALWRWRVNAKTKKVTSSERLCSEPSDFPCVDPRDVGRPHAFCYTAGYAAGTLPKRRMDVPGFDKVHKHDLATGKHYTYFLEKDRACGDVAFVPNAGDEKGGHLLVLTHDVAGDAAFARKTPTKDEDEDEDEKKSASSSASLDARSSSDERSSRASSSSSSRSSSSRSSARRAPTELLILADDRDEANPELRLVGKVKIPVRVPFGFHNEFVAEADVPPGAW